MRDLYWKDNVDDLRKKAVEVTAPSAASSSVSARQAAAILSGICALIARRWTVDEMQRTCAALARQEPFAFGRLPAEPNGLVSEPMALLASVARAVLPLAGATNLRAALSFWATEEDPAVWNQVAA
jgi:hypothetical protein